MSIKSRRKSSRVAEIGLESTEFKEQQHHLPGFLGITILVVGSACQPWVTTPLEGEKNSFLSWCNSGANYLHHTPPEPSYLLLPPQQSNLQRQRNLQLWWRCTPGPPDCMPAAVCSLWTTQTSVSDRSVVNAVLIVSDRCVLNTVLFYVCIERGPSVKISVATATKSYAPCKQSS